MSNITAYIILIIAVVLGTASNGFAKSAQGFTVLLPSIVTAITIVGCMFALSLVMKVVPVGITYASFAGLCIIATSIFGGGVYLIPAATYSLIMFATSLIFVYFVRKSI